MAALATKSKLMSRFHGALVGAIIGDCLGAHFEGREQVSLKLLRDLWNDIRSGVLKEQQFTDDTAMARSIAFSLGELKTYNANDIAKRFVDEYYRDKERGYGANVVTVFEKLKRTDFADIYQPAAEQFDGRGSYGNGGAMRIFPMALFAYNHPVEELVQLVADVTKITHHNDEAIKGAILQCVAVHKALHIGEGNVERLNNPHTFLEELIKVLPGENLAGKDDKNSKTSKEDYARKFECIGKFLKSERPVEISSVVSELGNNVSALGSVPAAIYSFLRYTAPEVRGDPFAEDSSIWLSNILDHYIADMLVVKTSNIRQGIRYKSDLNAFQKTIFYAISLGGDTDTIATMAGAIAGAFYGIEMIPASWISSCEQKAIKGASELVTSLYEAAHCQRRPLPARSDPSR